VTQNIHDKIQASLRVIVDMERSGSPIINRRSSSPSGRRSARWRNSRACLTRII